MLAQEQALQAEVAGCQESVRQLEAQLKTAGGRLGRVQRELQALEQQVAGSEGQQVVALRTGMEARGGWRRRGAGVPVLAGVVAGGGRRRRWQGLQQLADMQAWWVQLVCDSSSSVW